MEIINTLLIIFISGLIGGLAAYHLDKLDDSTKAHPKVLRVRGYLVIGIASSLVIPLFLHTASSNLLDEATKKPSLYFVLSGFCILAAIFSRRFLRSVGYHALKLAERNEKLLDEVAAQVSGLPIEVNRTRRLIQPISMIEDARYSEAITALAAIVKEDQQDAEAHAWLAYAYKNHTPPNYQRAAEEIAIALTLESHSPQSWLYNLACYKHLSGATEEEVVSILSNANLVGSAYERATLLKDLKTDNDFANLRSRGEATPFGKFLRSLERKEDGS